MSTLSYPPAATGLIVCGSIIESTYLRAMWSFLLSILSYDILCAGILWVVLRWIFQSQTCPECRVILEPRTLGSSRTLGVLSTKVSEDVSILWIVCGNLSDERRAWGEEGETSQRGQADESQSSLSGSRLGGGVGYMEGEWYQDWNSCCAVG